MDDSRRKLAWHGIFHFLLGLLTGFVEQKFVNPRIWALVNLAPRAKTAAYWIALYGTYVNWFTTSLAAAFGTAALSPITGAGHSGSAWQEQLVTALFMSVGLATVATALMVLWGLRAAARATSTTDQSRSARA